MKQHWLCGFIILGSILLGGCTTLPQVIYTPPLMVQPKAPQVKTGVPQRVPSQVIAVWVAPFIDADGNYHSGSEVYCVVRQEQWANTKARTLKMVQPPASLKGWADAVHQHDASHTHD